MVDGDAVDRALVPLVRVHARAAVHVPLLDRAVVGAAVQACAGLGCGGVEADNEAAVPLEDHGVLQRVERPHAHGAVGGGGEEGVELRDELDVQHRLRVPRQDRLALAGARVVERDVAGGAAAGHDAAALHGRHAKDAVVLRPADGGAAPRVVVVELSGDVVQVHRRRQRSGDYDGKEMWSTCGRERKSAFFSCRSHPRLCRRGRRRR
mmetsp:Transcript_38278/g.118307  ORF Transcript_38278/g.118307 Transcript_38278/m.118307 type:complete len:208 (-) Transcript_38278:116-739(-)